MERAVAAEDHASVLVVGHDLGHDESHAGIDRQPRALVGMGLVQLLAVRVRDLEDGLGRVIDALVGVGGDPFHVLEQSDRITAQGERGAVLIPGRIRIVAAERTIRVGDHVTRAHVHAPHPGEDGRHSDRQLDFDRGDVERVAHRLLERQHAMRLAVVVIDLGGAVRVLVDERRRAVVHRRVHRRGASVDHRAVRIGLHRGAHVAWDRRVVDLPAIRVVVGRSDHHLDVPCQRVDRHQPRRKYASRVASIVAVARVADGAGHVVGHGRLADLLHVPVERRFDIQLLDARLETELAQLGQHVVDEVRGVELVDGGVVRQLLRLRLVHLLLRDEVRAHHRAKDLGLAQLGRVGMKHRVPLRRSLRQARQHCRLREVELRRGDLEVAFRRGLDAV